MSVRFRLVVAAVAVWALEEMWLLLPPLNLLPRPRTTTARRVAIVEVLVPVEMLPLLHRVTSLLQTRTVATATTTVTTRKARKGSQCTTSAVVRVMLGPAPRLDTSTRILR